MALYDLPDNAEAALESVIVAYAGWTSSIHRRASVMTPRAATKISASLREEIAHLLSDDYVAPDVITRILRLYELAKLRDIPSVWGPIGLFLGLHAATAASATLGDAARLEETAREYLRDPTTLKELRELYQIPEAYDLNRSSLHRIGTTSIIFSCWSRKSSELTAPQHIALKLLLPRYFSVRLIRDRTKNYQSDHQIHHTAVPQIFSSSERYIAMQFVEGPTLADVLAGRRLEMALKTTPTNVQSVVVLGDDDIRFIRNLSLSIVRVLKELHNSGHRHLDLSPSNIILRTGDGLDKQTVEVALIDFGHNFALTEQPWASPAFRRAATYVAPELTEEDPNRDDWRCDAYSLGIIMLEATVQRHVDIYEINTELNRLWQGDDGWDGALGLARIVEELIDRDASNRLVLWPQSKFSNPYDYLEKLIVQETEVLDVLEENMGSSGFSTLRGFALIRLGRSPQIDSLFQAPKRISNPVDDTYAEFPKLAIWARIAILSWAVELSVFIALTLADIGISGLNPLATSALNAIHAPVDVGDLWGNLPGRLAGITFAIATVTYYINNYSILSPKQIGGLQGITTEWVMRANAVGLTLPILLAIGFDPEHWAYYGGFGSLLVVANNYLTLRMAKRAITVGEIFSTRRGREGARFVREIYKEWWALMGYYSLSMITFGVLLSIGAIENGTALAALVCFVNLGKMYRLNCTETSPQVRGSLSRDILTLRRAAMLKSQQSYQLTPRSSD